MASIAIVHGGAEQRGGTRPARDQYTSTHFEAAREYAEQVCDSWVIVSPRYDVVRPERDIEAYAVTREDFDPFEEMQWVKRLQRRLREVLFDETGRARIAHIVVLTDEYHTAALEPVYRQATNQGVTVEKPFEEDEADRPTTTKKRRATR